MKKNDTGIIGRVQGRGHIQGIVIATIDIDQGQGINQMRRSPDPMKVMQFPYVDLYNKTSEERRRAVLQWEEEDRQKKYEEDKVKGEAERKLGMLAQDKNAIKAGGSGHKQ